MNYMEYEKTLLLKIQKLREWEHLGLITTTGNTSASDFSVFLLEMELEAELLSQFNRNCGNCIHQKGICNNKDAYLFGCFVAPSIHCTYWEGSKL